MVSFLKGVESGLLKIVEIPKGCHIPYLKSILFLNFVFIQVVCINKEIEDSHEYWPQCRDSEMKSGKMIW